MEKNTVNIKQLVCRLHHCSMFDHLNIFLIWLFCITQEEMYFFFSNRNLKDQRACLFTPITKRDLWRYHHFVVSSDNLGSNSKIFYVKLRLQYGTYQLICFITIFSTLPPARYVTFGSLFLFTVELFPQPYGVLWFSEKPKNIFLKRRFKILHYLF